MSQNGNLPQIGVNIFLKKIFETTKQLYRKPYEIIPV